MEKKLKYLIKKYHYKNSVFDNEEIEKETQKYINLYKESKYNFSNCIDYSLYNHGNKKREIASVKKDKILELCLVEFLCDEIKRKTNLKYANRSQVMSQCLDNIRLITKFSDFSIVRFDFKNYFNSLSCMYIYEKCLKSLNFNKEIHKILENYAMSIKHCKAGIPLSNVFAEIIGKLFDSNLKSELSNIIFYARYIDDGIIIFNNNIPEDIIQNAIKTAIKKTFYDNSCKGVQDNKVSIHFLNKYKYINNSTLSPFDYLGYSINIFMNQNNALTYEIGISDAKMKKYLNKTINIIKELHKDPKLLRLTFFFQARRIVYTVKNNNDVTQWVTKGITYNYNELRNNPTNERTKSFLKNLYRKAFQKFNSMSANFLALPYYLKGNSIEGYDPYFGIIYNKAFIFDENIGINKQDLIKLIKNNTSISTSGKSYKELTRELLIKCKIGY